MNWTEKREIGLSIFIVSHKCSVHWYRSPWRDGPTPHGPRRSRQKGLFKNGDQGKWKIATGREQIPLLYDMAEAVSFMTKHVSDGFID